MYLPLVNTLTLLLMSLAAAYFFLAVGMGLRELRRQKVAVHFQDGVAFGHPFQPLDGHPARQHEYHLYFMIPCLDEAAVIGDTVAGLLRPTAPTSAGAGMVIDSRVVVIDDGSSDATATVARRAGGDQVTVITRRPPEARQGKGAALNAGFRHILDDVTERGLDTNRVILVVMDADGHLSDGAIDEVLPLFDDAAVGGVQLAVRIRNRKENFLLQFQEHQFWTLSSLTQFGRIRTGTVSLGGNGQFTRLRALLEVGDEPWSASLTEDLDLSVSLALRGWRLTSTPRAAVDQQGVDALRSLVRQRTRWYQGHMMSGRRIPEVLSSPRMNHGSSIEVCLYLLVPWVFDLPWSVLYHVVLLQIALRMSVPDLAAGIAPTWVAQAAVIYLLGFWPALVTAVLAKRRGPDQSWRRALKLGHSFVVMNYLSYVCVWSALWNMVRGRNGWAKTARIDEGTARQVGGPVRERTRVAAGDGGVW